MLKATDNHPMAVKLCLDLMRSAGEMRLRNEKDALLKALSTHPQLSSTIMNNLGDRVVLCLDRAIGGFE